MSWDPFNRPNRARRRQQPHDEERKEPPASASISPKIVERFEQELAQARRERDEWADRYQALVRQVEAERETLREETEQARVRLRTEAEGQRERLQRNAEQQAFEENRKILTRLLTVADNLERALTEADGEQSPLMEGVMLTYREFRRTLEETGVERIDTIGQLFDPSHHEAVATREVGGDEGIIVEEIEPGYLYRGALLRPAKVVVSD